MNNKKGRPLSYTDEQLIEILTNFAVNNVGKITFQNLEKATNIHRHVWSRRMAKNIAELNKMQCSFNGQNFEAIQLPNIIDTVNKHWENKTAMINALNGFNDYINALWEKAVAFEKTSQKQKELLQLLEEKDKEIRFLKGNRDFYKNEYQKIAIEGTYDHKQNDKKIKNVIEINDKEKMTSSNWKENFPDLFE